MFYSKRLAFFFINLNCQVLTPHGIIQTPSIFLGLDESITQEIIHQAASVASPLSRTTNKAMNDSIRRYIKSRKFNY